MSVFEYIIGAILIVFSLIIIFVVLLQEGRQANVGVISGAADTFLDKGAAKTWDMRLAKYTKVIAVVFFVLVLAGMLVTKYLSVDALKGNSGSGSSNGGAVTTTTTHDHDHDHTTTAGATTTTTAGGAATTTTVDEK
ncbi:MAG: preprotein translocase subunit SecG [Clostridia bacterium]|nr:preprotein translocase subunit SecG [Clostridia bacterium]